MTTLEIQRRLDALGFEPGPLDGVRGRRTIGAIKAFQAKHGLAADGIVGEKTAAALKHVASGYPSPSPQGGGERARAGFRASTEGLAAMPWYEEALRLKGVREAAGTSDNSIILNWAKRLGLLYRHDSIAWCGLFTAHCIAAALPDEALPSNPLGARNWLRFGLQVEPTLGAVLVFWRGTRSGAQGHVGFYAGEDASAFHVLGGNQSDMVSIARVARARLLGARWPATAPRIAGGITERAGGAALSTNEA